MAFRSQKLNEYGWCHAPAGIPWLVVVRDARRQWYAFFRTKKKAARYLRGVLSGVRGEWKAVHMLSRRDPHAFEGSHLTFERRNGWASTKEGVVMMHNTYRKRVAGPARLGRGREVGWQGWSQGKVGNQRTISFRRYYGPKLDPKIVE